MDQQTEACRQLMVAVVHLAILDACLPPYKQQTGLKLRDETKSAFDFLFNHGDVWLEFLDMDAGQFRTKLMSTMYGNRRDPEITDLKKRCFKMNDKLWRQLGAYRQVLGSECTE
jgi:hypothetical protein